MPRKVHSAKKERKRKRKRKRKVVGKGHDFYYFFIIRFFSRGNV